jgi:hypothetical protein
MIFFSVKGFKGQKNLDAASLWSHGWQKSLGLMQMAEAVFLKT